MLQIQPFKDVKRTTRAALPEFSKTWKPVTEFPNLAAAKSLAIDTETYDPELMDIGPGWGRGVGHIIGVSIATEDNAWYFPVRHQMQPELNMDAAKVFAFCKDAFDTPKPKIFANGIYDIGWLRTEGIKVTGPIYDVQFAEAILEDTARSYALDLISKKYLGEGKVSNDLYNWCSRAYGGKPDGSQRANMYRAPISLVGPYAEGDARQPFDILRKQWKLLELANLLDVFKLESDLIPLLVDIRMRGMPVSEERAQFAHSQLTYKIKKYQEALDASAGFAVNVHSGSDLERLYTKHNIDFTYTEAGNPSFTKDWLASQTDPFSQQIFDIRRFTKTRNDFIQGAILDKHTNNRVYPSFHPLRGDGGGAVTGRFAASKPAIQQIPSRDTELAPIIRGCFVPEEGMTWVKADYSAIELRIFAHFSNNAQLIKSYTDNPFMDYHDYVGKILGGKLPRIAVKTLNFSLLYGGGISTVGKQMARIFNEEQRRKLIRELGFPVLSDTAQQLARIFINIYDEEFPVAKQLLNDCGRIAAINGEMRTILNRRTSFNLFEPARGNGYALPLAQAQSRYGSNIRRAYTYKALNYRIQGSAADLLKSSMVMAYKEGLFDKIPFHGTVHDEFCLSYHPDLNKEFTQLREIAETSIKFNVPIIMDMEHGETWAEAKEPLILGERQWLKNM